ncbi:MAG: hypothetical protein U0M50_03550 [Paramuribaculum sp.]
MKQLLTLTPEEQQLVIDYGESVAAATDEEIAGSTVADDAPEMIRDLHRSSVRRARAAISRRKRSLKTVAEAADREERLSHSAERRLQWFRDTILPKLQRLLSACISEARNAFASLSHSQAEAVSRRACLLMVKSILPELKYLTASSYPQVSARIPSAG